MSSLSFRPILIRVFGADVPPPQICESASEQTLFCQLKSICLAYKQTLEVSKKYFLSPQSRAHSFFPC